MDPETLGRLIDRHADALSLYARQWCDTPEDVVQEAFVKLAGQGTLPENSAAWLFRVVRNGAINAGVAARRRQRHETEVATETPVWFDPEANTEQLAAEEAAEALASLPIDQREVIVAHLWGGLSFAQAAELAGCSSSTAHRLYHQGLNTLRERLGVACPSPRLHESPP